MLYKLCTNDINKVRQVMNSLISLKRTLSMRAEFEFPKLIADAEELIELLRETYLVE